MEALAAVGLASAVVQFVQFSKDVLQQVDSLQTISQHTPETLRDAREVAELARWRLRRVQAVPQSRPLTQREQLLEEIRDACMETADQLSGLFERLRCKDASPKRLAQFQAAFRATRKAGEIARLQARLSNHLRQLQQIDDVDIKVMLKTQGQVQDNVVGVVQATHADLVKLASDYQDGVKRQEALLGQLEQRVIEAVVSNGSLTCKVQQSTISGKARSMSIDFLSRIGGSQAWNTWQFVSQHASMLKKDYSFIPTEACEWIIQTRTFGSWLNTAAVPVNQKGHAFFALTGGRGTGKFLATSYITRYLLETRPKALVLNYCKLSWQTQSLTPHLLLKCIISQTIERRPEVLAALMASNNEKRLWKRFLAAQKSLKYHALFRIFSELILCDQIGEVFLVIDGLDTCSQRVSILKALLSVCGHTGLRIVVSDQNDAVVSDIYAEVHELRLEPGNINCDVDEYVMQQLTMHFPDRQYDHKRMRDEIVTGSEGQVSWARHILSCLYNTQDDKEFDEIMTKASLGKDMAIGHAFDRLRSEDILSRHRQQFLLKVACRALVLADQPIDIDAIVKHCNEESARGGRLHGKDGHTAPRYTFRSPDVAWMLQKLCTTTPQLVCEGPDKCYSFANSAIKGFFRHQVPPTAPHIPLLWLETDNCHALTCHLASTADDAYRRRLCRSHGQLAYADWYSENVMSSPEAPEQDPFIWTLFPHGSAPKLMVCAIGVVVAIVALLMMPPITASSHSGT